MVHLMTQDTAVTRQTLAAKNHPFESNTLHLLRNLVATHPAAVGVTTSGTRSLSVFLVSRQASLSASSLSLLKGLSPGGRFVNAAITVKRERTGDIITFDTVAEVGSAAEFINYINQAWGEGVLLKPSSTSAFTARTPEPFPHGIYTFLPKSDT
ncbi:hypothetical protein ABBQ32_009561 [Trebouxia sp. C0010 RCD-2024]